AWHHPCRGMVPSRAPGAETANWVRPYPGWTLGGAALGELLPARQLVELPDRSQVLGVDLGAVDQGAGHVDGTGHPAAAGARADWPVLERDRLHDRVRQAPKPQQVRARGRVALVRSGSRVPVRIVRGIRAGPGCRLVAAGVRQ